MPSAIDVRLEAERPRPRRRRVPAAATGSDEHVRHVSGHQVARGSLVGRRHQTVELGEDAVVDLVAHDRLRPDRRRLVVLVPIVDLPAVDAAEAVHVVEVRLGRGTDLAVTRRVHPGERLVAADPDRRRGHARDRRGRHDRRTGSGGGPGAAGTAAASGEDDRADRGDRGGDRSPRAPRQHRLDQHRTSTMSCRAAQDGPTPRNVTRRTSSSGSSERSIATSRWPSASPSARPAPHSTTVAASVAGV